MTCTIRDATTKEGSAGDLCKDYPIATDCEQYERCQTATVCKNIITACEKATVCEIGATGANGASGRNVVGMQHIRQST